MTIKDIIVSVTDQLAYSQGSKITTTEFSFALITRITSKILLIFSFIITIRQLFGYQWVTPTLLIMSALFYLPHFIWHNWECGTMEKLLKDMDSPYINEDCWVNQRDRLLRYLYGTKRYHKRYAMKYYCCEVLAFLTLAFNMHLMTLVFNNFWVEFFPAIKAFLRYDLVDFARKAATLFPSQAKCDFFNFGASGTIQHIDSLCFLPQNKVNEKIFVFLYFWFIALLIFSGLHIIFVAIKVTRQYRKGNDFGYGFVVSIIKKNLSPILVDDLLETRKLNTQ